MLPNSRKKHYDILLYYIRELINMNSNHFIITKDWLQEIICLFGDKSSDNPFEDVFFRCTAKCSHCGCTIGYNLVGYFKKATMIIWDKDSITDILVLNQSNWELVDMDAIPPKGSTINTLSCLPIPSLKCLPLSQVREAINTYITSENMLSTWFHNAIYKKGINASSEFTLTEELQTYVKLLQKANLGTPYIKSIPSTLLLRIGDVFSPGSGILLTLNKGIKDIPNISY